MEREWNDPFATGVLLAQLPQNQNLLLVIHERQATNIARLIRMEIMWIHRMCILQWWRVEHMNTGSNATLGVDKVTWYWVSQGQHS